MTVGWVFSVIAVLFGLIIGSFLNVVIHRGPVMWGLIEGNDGRRGTLAAPRSYCPSCGKTLRVFSLVPVFSYLLQCGKCANCAASISPRYPLIELAGGAAALIAYLLLGVSVEAFFFVIFLWTLIALAAIDAEIGYLPDALTLPLIVIGVAANIGDRFTPFLSSVIGAIAGYLVFRGVAEAFRRIRKKDGLGQGDAKLLAAFGAWGGWTILAPTVFIAAFAALIGVAIFTLFGRSIDRETEIPFGPALAAAGAIVIGTSSAGFDPNAVLIAPFIGL